MGGLEQALQETRGEGDRIGKEAIDRVRQERGEDGVHGEKEHVQEDAQPQQPCRSEYVRWRRRPSTERSCPGQTQVKGSEPTHKLADGRVQEGCSFERQECPEFQTKKVRLAAKEEE